MGTLIQNGTVVNATGQQKADVLIEGETITQVAPNIAPATHTIVDATGLYVMPGGVDAHTHMDMPFGGTVSADDFLTGTRAAAIGGTTTIVDFAIQARGTRMRDALDTWRAKAEGKACIDYGLHMIVTDLGSDAGKQGLADMDDMVREGVASFKLFMAYPNVLMVDDATIFKALQQTAKNGALICMHAENGSVIDTIVQQTLAEGKTAPIYHALTRPTIAEAEAVNRCIAMAEMAGTPVYIVHLSSEDALNQVREARDRGLPAFAETCPQYLLLSIEDQMPGKSFEEAKYVFTPPLREKKNQPKLWDGLVHDHLQVVSTDHCPFCFADQKQLGKDDFSKIPNGGPGVENRMQLLFHHGVNAGQDHPRALRRDHLHRARAHLRHVSKEGHHRRRSDADIVLWDPAAEHLISAATHNMRCDYSMFEGWKVKGNAQKVFSRGELVVDNGKYIAASRTRQLHPPRSTRRSLEMMPPAPSPDIVYQDTPHDPRLYNADLAPTTPAQRTWTTYNYIALWFSMSHGDHHLHARLVAHRQRHGLEAGRRHRAARQPHRAHSHAAQRARGREVRHSISRLHARTASACAAQTCPRCSAPSSPADGSASSHGSAARHPLHARRHLARSGAHARVLWACFLGFWLLNMIVVWRGVESIRFLQGFGAPFMFVMSPRAALLGAAQRPAASARCSPRPASFTQPANFSPSSSRHSPRWSATGPRSRSTSPTSPATPNIRTHKSSDRPSACPSP